MASSRQGTPKSRMVHESVGLAKKWHADTAKGKACILIGNCTFSWGRLAFVSRMN